MLKRRLAEDVDDRASGRTVRGWELFGPRLGSRAKYLLGYQQEQEQDNHRNR